MAEGKKVIGFKVYKTSCNNCLLSPDSIVSPSQKRDIIQECAQGQTHFICHKASMNDEDICCRKFYDTLGHLSSMVKISERLGMLEFVEQPDAKKLPTHKEMSI